MLKNSNNLFSIAYAENPHFEDGIPYFVPSFPKGTSGGGASGGGASGGTTTPPSKPPYWLDGFTADDGSGGDLSDVFFWRNI
jgi:hypothetical protein